MYMRWGKGPKQQLRFTKTGDGKLEEAYSLHFVWPGKGPFHPPATRREKVSERSGSGWPIAIAHAVMLFILDAAAGTN